MMRITFLVLFIFALCSGFSPIKSRVSMREQSKIQMSIPAYSMITSKLSDVMGILPLCIQATSKSTVTNDPTAGMTPEEISNYLDNVGGGMCGYPDIVRTFIGLGLNLSLVVFGVFTLAYVILGGTAFVLEKRVDDLIEKESQKYPEFNLNFQSIQYRGENNDGIIFEDDEDEIVVDSQGNTSSRQRSSSSSSSGGANTSGLNRQERRLRKNFIETKKKD